VSTKTTVGLTAWLTLLVIGAVVPLLLLAGLTFLEISNSSKAIIEQGLADTTRALALAVDGEIHSWKASLEALAASRSLQPGRLAEFYGEARQVAAQYDGWIVLTDARGHQVLNTLRSYGTPLPTTTSPEAIGDTLKDGKPMVSDLFFGKVSQRFVVAVTVPVVREGKVTYALTMTFGPERLIRLLARQELPATWVAAINDRERRVVARSRDNEGRIGKPVVEWYAAATRAAESGIATGPRVDGTMSRFTFQRLQEVPWIVGVAVPISELQSAAPVWRFILIGVVLVLAALGAAVFSGRRITAPVARLAAAGGPLVRGEDVDLGPASGIRQVRELQQALAEASESIQLRFREREQAEETLRRANEALEVRVQERTAALAKANETLQTTNTTLQEDIQRRKRAEEALRESEERLKRAQEIAHLGSWELDLVHNRLTWSDEAYRIFGLQPQEFGATYEAFLQRVYPDDRAAVDAAYSASLRDGRDTYEIEHRVVRKDTGEIRLVHEKCEHFRDASGQIVRSVGMVHDITDRKRMEDEIRALAKFPEENPYPVLRIASGGRILYANRASDLLLQLWDRQVGHDLPEAWRARVGEVYAAGRPEELEVESAGHTFACILVPIADAGYINIYGRDITARKRAEDEVLRLNTELQQRLVELGEANEELESFSYSISHDLRAPLRAINGFSRILVEEHGPQLLPEAQRYLRLVRENTQQMGRLVDDLLAFSRLSRQPLQRQSVNLTPMVHEVFASLQEERANRRVELVVGDLAPCEGDPALLKQVVVNLLGNALKFTRGRETACIEIRCRTQAGVQVYSVQDNGVGFDMLYVDKLFGVFQRLHRAEEYEGTGVGLAIVQRIIQRHGGRVCAEGEIGKGATFYFTVSGWPPTFPWRK
jgi:PAS domain S-box-containing protein